ncbi:GNAT family N-acetyltransferase [Novipirellula rosea]|uniref:N-acetyltransferase domain-containing protein n=1 Tax=Novipirellula rosea TaxID=1031540 RepID=A0ABP8MQK1_9BACT
MTLPRVEFRKIRTDGPVVYWYVEAYSPDDFVFPVGTGYVLEAGTAAHLSYILVADQWRRKGYGTAIFQACKSRWTNFISTGSMDSASELFMSAAGILKTSEE